jgi:magnesium chelatase subunit D
VRDACRLALPHRRRRDPFDAPGLNESDLDEAMAAAREAAPDNAATDNPGPEGSPDGPASEGPSDGPSPEGPSGGPESDGPSGGPESDGPEPEPDPPSGSSGPADEAEDDSGGKHSRQDASGPAPQQRPAAASEPYRTRLLAVQGVGKGQRAGRRSPARSRTGRVVAARRPQARLTSLHTPATLFAAAPHQVARGRLAHGGTGLVVRAEDLREAVHRGREANLLLFVVDASGSMAARQRMRAVKGAVLSLLRDAYQRRDKVGLVTFRGADADLVLPPTTSHEIAAVRLRELATGGRTPLYAGLRKAARVVAAEQRRDPHRRPLLIVVTDGRATHGPDPASLAPVLSRVSTVIVDCESGPVRLGLAGRLATALGAVHLRLDALSADGLRTAAGRGGPLSGTGLSGPGLPGTGLSGPGLPGPGLSGPARRAA